MKRYCLEKCDEEGKKGDYVDTETDTNDDHRRHNNSKNGTTNSSNTNLSKTDVEKTVTPSTVPSSSSAATVAHPPRRLAAADCESELESIIAETEAALSPLWAEDVEGVSSQMNKPSSSVLATGRKIHDRAPRPSNFHGPVTVIFAMGYLNLQCFRKSTFRAYQSKSSVNVLTATAKIETLETRQVQY